MSEPQMEFIKEFKKQLIIYAFVGISTIIGTAVGFYYNTQSSITAITASQQQLDSKQKENEREIDRIRETKIDRAAYVREIDEVKMLLRSMDEKISRLK